MNDQELAAEARRVGYLLRRCSGDVDRLAGELLRQLADRLDALGGDLDAIRGILAGFDWERDDRQYALEQIEMIADKGQQ